MMRTKIVLFLGILVALVISVAVTVPYVLTWSSYNSQAREMNFVSVLGEKHTNNMSNSLVNITLFAVYPKAAAHTTYNVFRAQLIYLVTLDPSVTNFRIEAGKVMEFLSADWSHPYVGWSPRDFQSNFYRFSETGEIAPYFVNTTIEMNRGETVSHPWWYLAGTIEVYPEASLYGYITLHNDYKNSSSISFLFDMADYPTSIHFFSYSFTLWVVFGSSVCIAVLPWLVSYYVSRKHKK